MPELVLSVVVVMAIAAYLRYCFPRFSFGQYWWTLAIVTFVSVGLLIRAGVMSKVGDSPERERAVREQTGGGDLLPETEEPRAIDTCDDNYEPCVPITYDVDCIDGRGDGPEYVGQVRVIGVAVYGLDDDNDGFGCEPMNSCTRGSRRVLAHGARLFPAVSR